MTFRGRSEKYYKIRINKTKGRERYGTFNRDSVRRAELRDSVYDPDIRRNTGKRVGRSYLDYHGGNCRTLYHICPKLERRKSGKGSAFIGIRTVLIYIGIANIIGLFGFKSPTKDLNVTAALAIMSMCLIEFSGIRKNGFKHWAAHFAKPVPFVAPIMVLEIVIRPLSLCMRLFGNVLGAFVIMELLKAVAPVLIPIPFSFYFDIFDGFLQAYVFVFLTALFMNEEQE